MSEHIEAYRRKRDMIVGGLAHDYEVTAPGGAFYVFPKAPWGTGTEFVTEAIRSNPGLGHGSGPLNHFA